MKKLLLPMLSLSMLMSLATVAFEKSETSDINPETAALQRDIDAIKSQQTKVNTADAYELGQLVELLKEKSRVLKQKAAAKGREELDKLNRLITDLESKIKNLKTKIK